MDWFCVTADSQVWVLKSEGKNGIASSLPEIWSPHSLTHLITNVFVGPALLLWSSQKYSEMCNPIINNYKRNVCVYIYIHIHIYKIKVCIGSRANISQFKSGGGAVFVIGRALNSIELFLIWMFVCCRFADGDEIDYHAFLAGINWVDHRAPPVMPEDTLKVKARAMTELYRR